MVAVPPSAAGCKPTVVLDNRPLTPIVATGSMGRTMEESGGGVLPGEQCFKLSEFNPGD